MTQGERVKEVRKTLNLTLEKFGEKLGVGKTAISKIEKNERTLTEQMSRAICREYNVNEEWLRNETGEMFNEPSDEVAEIVSEFIENPDSNFYKVVLSLAHTYLELSPKDQASLDKYAKELLNNLKKTESSQPNQNPE